MLALACALAAPALAETLKTLAPSKPAPGGERRIALVIGNSAYKDAPLRNPANDARAIAEALSATGFSVTILEDATQLTMRRAMRGFGNALSKATVGLFYYAGHGMQVKGANYLLPVNADIEHEDEVQDQAVDANLVLSKMDSAQNSLNIMILDACRNNPFARSFRSAAKGLAQMDAPSGTLISFATAPGSVASDGAGKNGLYTEHLLQAMHTPGLPIEHVFKQVRIGVTRATKNQQIPWESSSLKGDFSFVPGAPVASAASGSMVSQDAMQKAVQEATRAADERATRERDAMQARMEKMVADMLARQQATLEAERAGKGGTAPVIATRPASAIPASAPAAAAKSAPVAAPVPSVPLQVASTSPTPVVAVAMAPDNPVGDRWRYVGKDVYNSSLVYSSLVEVLGATPTGVIESTTNESGQSKEWVYTDTPTLVGGVGPMAVFSPLIGPSARSLSIGQTWRGIKFELVGECSHGNCSGTAEVVAFEKVTTAGGSFEAYRINLHVISPGLYGARAELVFWYSPRARHVVKYTARTRSNGNANPIALADMEGELVAYQLAGQAAVGSMPEASLAAAETRSVGVLVATTGPISGINAGGSAAPKVGDRWEYSDTYSGRPLTRAVEVTQVSGGMVREKISGEGIETVSIDHSGGAYLVGAGMIQFSPYLLAFGNPAPGTRLADVRSFNVPNCSGCNVAAQVIGMEKISVPAGAFDAIKLEASYSADGARGTLTYWYAPAARRMVKAQVRVQPTARVPTSNVGVSHDIELVSLKLQ